jgi:hypothetical protein
VIFSLQELARMEDERVRDQAEAARLEEAAREAARRRAEVLAREELEAREREGEERRLEAERKDREAAARAEAVVEAARVEAEGRLRAAEREREMRHDLERLVLAKASAEGDRGARRRSLLTAVSAASVTALLAAVGYLGVVRPAEQAREARWASELASSDTLVADARAQAAKAGDSARSLSDELAVARGQLADLRQQVEDGHRSVRTTPSAVGNHSARTTPAHDPTMDGFSRCPPGSQDPMCAR